MKNRTIPYLSGRFFDGISSGMFMMALPWIMLSTDGMGTFVAVTALVCTSVSFVVTPFFATLIDRHSRKNILIVMQLVQFSTALLVFTAYWNGAESHWLLASSQLVFWLSNDLAWSTNNAFTQENYREGEYTKISSYQEVVMQVTTLGAGALGIILLESWSMVEFALLATLASFLSGVSYIATPYKRQFNPSSKEPFFEQLVASKTIFAKQPHFYAFLALSCLSYPVLTFLVKLVPIYFAEQGVNGSWFATWKMSYGVGALLSGLIIARLMARYNHEKSMIFSVAAMGAILLVMGSYLSPTLIVLLTISLGFFNSYNRIARTNKMHHVIAMEERGRVEGGLKLFSTLAQSLSYVVIALLSYLQLTALGFVLIGIVLLIAGVMMLNLNRSSGVHAPRSSQVGV